MKDKSCPRLVPIVVGATGHRDIPAEDEALLTASVREVLSVLKRDHPDSPCVLLSSLAEGGDRIAARAALDAGWELGVILPLPVEDFEADFPGEESLAEFRTMLAAASWIHVCGGNQERPHCYTEASAWMARHAQTVIALWDGVSPEVEGGTSHTVSRCLKGPGAARLTLPDTRPVIQVRTRRVSRQGEMPASLVGTLARHEPRPAELPSDGEEERWQTIMRRINEFNRDARAVYARFHDEVESQRRQLNEGRPIEDAAISNAANAASWIHAVAGQISLHTQQRRDRHFRGLIIAAVVAIFLEQVYSGPFPKPALLAMALLSGIISYVLYRRGIRQRLEDRYIDYRALAEACRVQYFWKRAGLGESAGDYLLRDQRDELEWIRQAVLSTELVSTTTLSGNGRDAALEHARRCWLEDQRVWLVVGNAHRPGGKQFESEGRKTRLQRTTGRLMLAGVSMIFVVTMFHALVAARLGALGDLLTQSMIVTYGMMFVGAAIIKAVQETKAYEEQSQRYRRAGLSMTLACRYFDEAMTSGNLEKAEAILFEAGREALAENTEWLLVHRQRPVKVPIG